MIGVEIEVCIVDAGKIRVKHSFFGRTEDEARGYLEKHLDSCEYFRANYDKETTIETVDDEVELPEPDDYEEDDED